MNNYENNVCFEANIWIEYSWRANMIAMQH